MIDRWQPVPLVARAFGIPDQTIRTWIRRRQIGAQSRSGTIYVDTAEVMDRRDRNLTVAA